MITKFLKPLILLTSIQLAHSYELDHSDVLYRAFNMIGDDYRDLPADCRYFPNGLIRGWFLEEKNQADFFRSFINCRDMAPSGLLGSEVDRVDHFNSEGNGRLTKSQISIEQLPVGVMVKYIRPQTDLKKIVDINLLSNSASKIAGGSVAYQMSNWATGRDTVSNLNEVILCQDGRVVTGIKIRTRTSSLNSRREIEGLALTCTMLVK